MSGRSPRRGWGSPRDNEHESYLKLDKLKVEDIIDANEIRATEIITGTVKAGDLHVENLMFVDGDHISVTVGRDDFRAMGDLSSRVEQIETQMKELGTKFDAILAHLASRLRPKNSTNLKKSPKNS